MLKSRDLSGRVPLTEPQTNQRAELHGIKAAIIKSKNIPGDLEIRTDSKYAAKGLVDFMEFPIYYFYRVD